MTLEGLFARIAPNHETWRQVAHNTDAFRCDAQPGLVLTREQVQARPRKWIIVDAESPGPTEPDVPS